MKSTQGTFGGALVIDHVLLTRFNLPSQGYESLIRAKDGWLRERLDLFETYCLPSVRSQSCMPSKWIVYFDPDSPPWLIDRVRALNVDNVFRPVFRAEVSRSQLLADIEIALGRRGSYLLTTNVDNDDGLASDFAARIRTVPPADGTIAIYLVNGLIRTTKAAYARADADNAFCSVLTPWADPKTCWSDWHNRLRHSMPVVRLEGEPAWLQVIHESNVSNRVHGKRVSPERYTSNFPGLLNDIKSPSRNQLVQDRVVLGPARRTRDALRGVAKAVIQATSGRDKTDSLKVWRSLWVQNMRSRALHARSVARKSE